MRSWLWGGLGGRRGNDSNGGPGHADPVRHRVRLAWCIAPIAGEIIKRAVSRNREFLADAQGAMLTRYPPGLVAALRKIAASPTAMHSANNATAHLWLSQPSRIEGDEARADGEDLRHPPSDRRADPPPRGDVTFVSNSTQVFGTPPSPV